MGASWRDGTGAENSPLSVRDVAAVGHGDDVREADTEVLSDDLVHADIGILTGVVGEDNTHGVLSLLSLDQDCVSAEELARKER